MSALVRRARPSDLPVALPLWQALHREHEAADPRYRMSDDASARWSTDFRDWARSRTSAIWLAMDGGPVGLLTAHLYEPAPAYRPVSLIHVDDLFVAPEARGRGVGQAMLAAARDWGRGLGATRLQAGVLAANADARRFWDRAGASDFSVTVTLDLGEQVEGGG